MQKCGKHYFIVSAIIVLEVTWLMGVVLVKKSNMPVERRRQQSVLIL